MKSTDQRSFAFVGTGIGTLGRVIFLRRWLRTCRPSSQ